MPSANNKEDYSIKDKDVQNLINYAKVLETILENVTFGKDFSNLKFTICPEWIDDLKH